MYRDVSKVVVVIVVSLCYLTGQSTCENELARGLNDNINWVTLEEGEKLSLEQGRPMMLIIHKSWCGACKALKPKFAASEEIEQLSRAFVMVNVMDDDEPKDPKFSPDGGYIPRILFRGVSGEILTDIINEGGNDQYKYYYFDTASIVKSMHKCLETVKRTNIGADEL